MSTEPTLGPIEQFKALLLPLKDAYTYAGLSYHAIQGESSRIILHARLFLQPRPIGVPEKSIRFLDQEVGYYPLSKLKVGLLDLLDKVHRGVPFETPDGPMFLPLSPGSTAQSRFHPLHGDAHPNSRLAVLTVSGAPLPGPRFSDELDWILKGNDPPYDRLWELLYEFRLGGFNGDFSCLEIPAAHLVEVDFASPVSGEIAEPSVLLAPGLDRSSISIGIVVHHQGEVVQRLVLPGASLSWSERNDPPLPVVQIGRGRVKIPVGSTIKCFSAYKGVVQHEGWIGDPGSFPNWRRTVYQVVDSSCEVLRDFLFEDKRARKESRDFETGVASLLWMLGFGVLQLRSGRLQDNPDLLLTTPAGRVVMVECTTDVIDKEGKLAKLHARARSMKDQLEKSGSGHVELLPVLVTSLPLASIMDIEKASKIGILVLTKEDLQAALDRSLFPQDLSTRSPGCGACSGSPRPAP